MAYATLAEFKRRLGSSSSPLGLYEQLTDRIAATTANDTVGQDLLDEAQALINMWLAKRYATPVSTADAATAATLRKVTLDLAEYGAWASAAPRRTLPERVKQAFDAAMEWLRDVAAGKAELPGAAAAEAAESSSAEAAGYARVWTEEGLEGP